MTTIFNFIHNFSSNQKIIETIVESKIGLASDAYGLLEYCLSNESKTELFLDLFYYYTSKTTVTFLAITNLVRLAFNLPKSDMLEVLIDFCEGVRMVLDSKTIDKMLKNSIKKYQPTFFKKISQYSICRSVISNNVDILICSIINEKKEIFEFLLNYYDDVNMLDSVYKSTPLMFAAQHNQLEMCKQLLNKGALIFFNNKSALYYVYRTDNPGHSDQEECAKLLINVGADIECLGWFGESIYSWAVRYKNSKAIESKKSVSAKELEDVEIDICDLKEPVDLIKYTEDDKLFQRELYKNPTKTKGTALPKLIRGWKEPVVATNNTLTKEFTEEGKIIQNDNLSLVDAKGNKYELPKIKKFLPTILALSNASEPFPSVGVKVLCPRFFNALAYKNYEPTHIILNNQADNHKIEMGMSDGSPIMFHLLPIGAIVDGVALTEPLICRFIDRIATKSGEHQIYVPFFG